MFRPDEGLVSSLTAADYEKKNFGIRLFDTAYYCACVSEVRNKSWAFYFFFFF